MKRLRERYCIFRRSLGLPTALDARLTTTPAATSTTLTTRPPRTTAASFSEIVRSLPAGLGEQLRTMFTDVVQQEIAAANRLTNTRVGDLEAAHRQTEATQKQHAAAITTLETKQDGAHNSIQDLTATQQTMREEVTVAQASVKGMSAAVASHTQAWKDLNDFLTEQTAQMDDIKSSLQTLFKRRHADSDRDGEARPAPASPGHGMQR